MINIFCINFRPEVSSEFYSQGLDDERGRTAMVFSNTRILKVLKNARTPSEGCLRWLSRKVNI